MEKPHILDEIRRTAAANGGVALGVQRFYTETGVKESDWRGRFWARWGDALLEASFSPNEFNPRIDDSLIIEKLIDLTREFGRFPTQAEMELKRIADPSFPSRGAIRRLGTQQDLIGRALDRCCNNPGYDDVKSILAESIATRSSVGEETINLTAEEGFVYLIRSGRFYKIGRTNALGRRERELAIQLPDKAVTVHSIKTDDPAGIEAYWHKRFEAKRGNGEWFELSSADVHAFKRRKFM
jgi:Meiotically up-regulated gene 113